MKRRVLITSIVGIVLTLAMGVYFSVASPLTTESSNTNDKPVTKEFTVQKNGETATIVGRKDTASTVDRKPPAYEPSEREWTGDAKTWAQIEQVIREGFQAKRDATLYENRGRIAEKNENLADYYSDKSGELQRVQNFTELHHPAPGIGRAESVITKMDFKGISVQDTMATVVVDVWSHVSDKDFNTNQKLGPDIDTAKQHTVTLELVDNRWLISEDLWVHMPGYEP
ncbi:MAG: hypothetical protein ACYC5A_06675 [Thermoleophilia bacterium]